MRSINLRPSAAGRWFYCHGSPEIEAQFPDVENDIAREGTAMHEACELILDVNSPPQSAIELVDRRMSNGVYITEEMVPDIDTACQYVRDLNYDMSQIMLEKKLDAGLPYSGTADVACFVTNQFNQTIVDVIDFKFGYKTVEATGNKQGTCYLHLVIAKLGIRPDRVRFHVVQPRAWHIAGRTRCWDIDFETFWNEHVTPLYQAALLSGTLTAGPHCAYCKALARCPAARQSSEAAINIALNYAAVENQPALVVGEELRLLEMAANAIDLRKKALEQEAIDRIKSKEQIPGWEMQKGFGKRRYSENVTDELLRQFGESVGVNFFSEQRITPAEAERRNIDKSVLKQLTYVPETGYKLKKVRTADIMERMDICQK